jgi:hypothetical protein
MESQTFFEFREGKSLLTDATDVESLIEKVFRTRFAIPNFCHKLLCEWFPHYFPHHYPLQNGDSSEDFFH